MGVEKWVLGGEKAAAITGVGTVEIAIYLWKWQTSDHLR